MLYLSVPSEVRGIQYFEFGCAEKSPNFRQWLFMILFNRFLKILVALNKEKAQVLVRNFVKLSAKFG